MLRGYAVTQLRVWYCINKDTLLTLRSRLTLKSRDDLVKTCSLRYLKERNENKIEKDEKRDLR